MKRLAAALAAALMAVALTACANQGEPAASTEPAAMPDESRAAEEPKSLPDDRVLIVYFSHSGTTEHVSDLLREKTGGDVFELLPATPYPDDMYEASDRTAEELESGALPELTGELPDVSDYDLILVGGPVWSEKAAPLLASYLSQTDFEGRAVAPFWTYNGNEGAYEENATGFIQDADVRGGLGLPHASSMEDGEMNRALDQWLDAVMGSQAASEERETAIAITIGDQTIEATLNDSPAAREFREMLPLTLSMTRMGEHEYYGSLPRALSHAEDLQTGYTVGDLAFWTPGDLFALYFDEPQDEPEGLMILGRITSDLSVFAQLGNPEEVHIELAGQ